MKRHRHARRADEVPSSVVAPSARKPGRRAGRHLSRREPTGPARSALAHARLSGAQPGNHNALKHGYYSSLYKQSERHLLEQGSLTELSAEIELIRVTNKRFLQALQASKSELDFETQLTALRAVNLSAHSLATLLRAQALGNLYRRDIEDRASEPPASVAHSGAIGRTEAAIRAEYDSPADE